MKKLLLTLVFIPQLFFGQIKIEVKGMLNQMNEDGFWVRQKKGVSFIDFKGNILLANLTFKNKMNDFRPTIREKLMFNNISYEYHEIKKMYRLINLKGEAITDYIFNDINPFITDNTYAKNEKNEGLFINQKGDIIATIDLDRVLKSGALKKNEITSIKIMQNSLGGMMQRPYYEDLAIYRVRGKFGYINLEQEFHIQPIYSNARDFSEGLAAVSKKENYTDLWGFINKNGDTVVPFEFSREPGPFVSGLAMVKNTSLLNGYINNKGELIIDPKYKFATDFYKGFALVKEKRNAPTLLINKTGEIKNSFESKILVEVSDENLKTLIDFEKVKAKINDPNQGHNRMVILGINGNIITKKPFNNIFNFNKNGMILGSVTVDNNIRNVKKGVFNEQGDVIIDVVKHEF